MISVDTKKKENIGYFSNNGTEYRPKGEPRHTLDHDFPIKELGKVAPYGIYCLNDNTGFVNLGTDHDTSEFAMFSIYLWWIYIGRMCVTFSDRVFQMEQGGTQTFFLHVKMLVGPPAGGY